MKKLLFISIIVLIILAAIIFGYTLILKGGYFFYTPKILEKTVDKAIATNNPSLCENLPKEIPDTQPRKDCYFRVAIGLKDISVCKKYDFTTSLCIIEVAVAKKDITLCEELNSKEVGYCQNYFARNTLDFSICDKIKDTLWKDHCFSERAINENDLKWCELISNNTDKEDCYSLIAAKKSDIIICRDMIFNNTIKNLCFERVAVSLKNLSMCETIPELKESCKKIYGMH